MQVRKAVERRRFAIQAIFSLLTNSYVVGFLTGTIYKGPLKQICVPGMNCYSCPGALGACPIGSLQAIFNQSDFQKASGRTATAIWSRNRFTILRFTLSAFLCSSAHFAEGSFAVFFARSD